MTLHKIKQVFVEEKKMMTGKELTILVAKLGAGFIGLAADLSMLTMNLLGLPVTILVIFGLMFAFNSVFDMVREDETTLKAVKRFANLFFVFYILLVVEFLVLKYLRFI